MATEKKVSRLMEAVRPFLTPGLIGAIATGMFTVGQWSYAWLNNRLLAEEQARVELSKRVTTNENTLLTQVGINSVIDTKLQALKDGQADQKVLLNLVLSEVRRRNDARGDDDGGISGGVAVK